MASWSIADFKKTWHSLHLLHVLTQQVFGLILILPVVDVLAATSPAVP